MKINLSETAAQQLYGKKEKSGLPPEEIARLAEEESQIQAKRDAKRDAKQAAKQVKVDARNAAISADQNLQTAYDALLSTDKEIKQVDRRLEKDHNEHRIRVERERNRLQNLQRQLENLHAEMMEAKKILDTTRADVPASVAGMDQLLRGRREKLISLQEMFSACEQAFKNSNLTNSAKGKRNKNLRRSVKGILSEGN